MVDWSALPFHRYQVELCLARPLAMPSSNRSVLWRGAFGAVFRSLVCHDTRLDCATCPLRARCPYPAVFAPSARPDRPEIARLRDPPRPFVLRDPRPDDDELPADRPLPLGITLVGTAATELPYFVVTFRRLGEEGLGRDRVRFRVAGLRALDAAGLPTGDVLAEDGSVRLVTKPLTASDLARPGDADATRVRIRFRTPTDVRHAGEQPGDAPSFGALIRRARDRAGALAAFYGGGSLVNDPSAVAEAASRVALVQSDVSGETLLRRSARTGERHPLEGVVGWAAYEGPGLGALLPWLRVAEVLGVGKHTTFGQGQIEVGVLG